MTCDGFDDDCNGLADDGYVPAVTTCGEGACTGNTGFLECIGGTEVDSCDPFGGAAPDDAICDGIDEDCDGASDEDFMPTPSTCGVGVCSGNTGILTCDAGSPVDSCEPFEGATPDNQCNGLDDDCDGTNDDDYVPPETTCGVGECADNTGLLTCLIARLLSTSAGALFDTCEPFEGATADDQCNGRDEDCDGVADDDYIPAPTTCGTGQCAGNVGVLECFNGTISDTCEPFAGATEEICDGVDNDCNGIVDDGPPAGDIGSQVRMGPDKAAITWAAMPDANEYNAYRGSIIPSIPFIYDHNCFKPHLPEPQTTDVVNPPLGRVFYYLVSAANSCQGEDTLGTDSRGIPRPNDNPCF